MHHSPSANIRFPRQCLRGVSWLLYALNPPPVPITQPFSALTTAHDDCTKAWLALVRLFNQFCTPGINHLGEISKDHLVVLSSLGPNATQNICYTLHSWIKNIKNRSQSRENKLRGNLQVSDWLVMFFFPSWCNN